jgi:transcriptional regulator with XRE-family HTH domain
VKFRTLQENLRKALSQRVESGELTQLRLAGQTGFKQAHISNFLNRKRGLSIEGMDKVLSVLRLSLLDLLDPNEVNKRASILPPSEDDFDSVAVTDSKIAALEPTIRSMHVKELQKFKRLFLRRLRENAAGDRNSWERFVVIKADAREGMSMYPRLLPGASILLDRRYNSLAPYRKGEQNMYAVRKDDGCTIKYVTVSNRNLVLRPHNSAYPVELLPIEEGMKAHDYIVGRVCHVGIET